MYFRCFLVINNLRFLKIVLNFISTLWTRYNFALFELFIAVNILFLNLYVNKNIVILFILYQRLPVYALVLSRILIYPKPELINIFNLSGLTCLIWFKELNSDCKIRFVIRINRFNLSIWLLITIMVIYKSSILGMNEINCEQSSSFITICIWITSITCIVQRFCFHFISGD